LIKTTVKFNNGFISVVCVFQLSSEFRTRQREKSEGKT